MRWAFSVADSTLWALVAVLGALPAGGLAQQPGPEDAALALLNGARLAYNEGKCDLAAERFREFLKLYGGHKQAPSAHYGLGLSLLEAPQKDYAGAIQSLQQVVGRGDFPDRPLALYYMGAAQRGAGEQALGQAAAKPNEAPQHGTAAMQNFTQAAQSFAAAAAAFAARATTKPPTPPAAPPADLEWAARAGCDHAEMLLRLSKFKEAASLAEAFLADHAMTKSGCRDLARYHLGYAHFAMKDYLAAGRALSQLAPFQQDFGLHARYLLARTHHLAEERPEAAAQYEAVLAGYEQRKKAAQEALKNPAALKPPQRASFEALVNSPPPDYILRASFYAALLLAEQGQYADALVGFSALIQKYPKSPLVPEAQLRQGYCQMELRNFPEAIKALQPLCQHPQLSDRALWWLGRSQIAAADPKNAQAYAQALAAAMNSIRAAADRAAQLAPSDPQAKLRRGDILMQLADTQQLAGQNKEAAATYQLVLTEKGNPDRAEEAMQRQVTALHLAGQYKESDALCQQFEKTYPNSTLLPAVLFRGAEGAYLTATAAARNPNLPNRQNELRRLFGEAISRYQRVIQEYPEFAYANLARYGMAAAHYRLGQYADARAILARIPEADRTGELAAVGYLLADCLIRTLPDEAGDALQAARLAQQARQAAKLLESFLAAQPNSPQAPDALLKLGHCCQRIAAVLAGPAQQQEMLTAAKAAYDRFLQQFGKDPSLPAAVFERAKCLALLGDANGASGELNRFRADPLRLSPVAPLALLRLSALLRAQNRPADAAAVLAQCRSWHEAELLKDPARSDWVPLLQYEHALAVKESGKLPEARTMLEALAKQFPAHPQAVNALWRAGECRREELTAQLGAARAAAANPAANPQQAAAAKQAMEQGLRELRQTIDGLEVQADGLGRRAPGSEQHLHMLYEVAWCYRVLAQAQIEAARHELQQQALEEVRGRLAKQRPPGEPAPALLAPEVPLSAISMRLAERAARDQYKRLIAAAAAHSAPSGEPPLAIQARFELAEMLAQRDEHDAALALLAQGLEKNPPLELGERIRLRMGCCFLAKQDAKSALAHVLALARSVGSPLNEEARYLAGEAYILQQDWANAVKELLPFRDQGPLQNVAGISDRALLQLGHAYAQAGQWDAARHTLNVLVQRFPQSPWVGQAHYGIGWSWQSQQQHDQAVSAYAQVTRQTAAEVAARAQLQIGLCRLEQKRYPEAVNALLAVPLTYDYPECSAAAWCEAARAYLAMNQPAEAAKLLQRVMKDHPGSRWAQLAQQRLAEIEQAPRLKAGKT